MYTQNPQNLTLGNYTLNPSQILGKGATGIVYKGISHIYQGMNNIDKSAVAIKSIQLSTIKDDATKSLLENEKKALKMVNNQNIIKLLDIIEMNDCCYIITEMC